MEKYAHIGFGMPQALRLGFATRGNTHPEVQDLLYAYQQGVNYWNWCGYDDGMSRAVGELGDDRKDIILATQIGVSGWSRDAMRRQIESALKLAQTEWIDVVTLYYVESQGEWNQITHVEGALKALQEAKQAGVVKLIGVTTHQRPLAAQWAESGLLDLLMIRYNAAHRGAATEVFPVAQHRQLPVIGFTCLRWGALMQPTTNDPDDFVVPRAPEWYRYVLSNPAVSVALMAPDNREELIENLVLLEDWHELSAEQRQSMELHGDRVRDAAGPFP